MNKEVAIKKLEDKIQNQHPFAWKYAGQDYQNEIMGAETALNSLLGLDSWMTEVQAIEFAEKLN